MGGSWNGCPKDVASESGLKRPCIVQGLALYNQSEVGGCFDRRAQGLRKLVSSPRFKRGTAFQPGFLPLPHGLEPGTPFGVAVQACTALAAQPCGRHDLCATGGTVSAPGCSKNPKSSFPQYSLPKPYWERRQLLTRILSKASPKPCLERRQCLLVSLVQRPQALLRKEGRFTRILSTASPSPTWKGGNS